MQALDVLPDDLALEQMIDRVPVHLLTGLTDMGFNFVVNEVGAETRVVIWRRRDGEPVCGLTDTPTPSVAGIDVDCHPDGSRRVDVRHLPKGEKHPTIFSAFDRLAIGEAFVLLNDHDPRPHGFSSMPSDRVGSRGSTWKKGPRNGVSGSADADLAARNRP